MPRVLVASPIRRKPQILRHFLRGLEDLDRREGGLNFAFIDDCDDPAASALLRAWQPPAGDGTVIVPQDLAPVTYDSANDWHRWNWRLTYRVAALRNKLLDLAQGGGYSHILLVDSDLVLRPDTLEVLLAAERDIIAEVFWTKFYANSWIVPNAWIWGETAMYRVSPDEDPKRLKTPEIQRRIRAWFREIRRPGVYEVGGTGACTLISRRVIEAGVNYSPIHNLGWWGEDRFFCVRAAVAGFRIHLDTNRPPLHLYRDTDLRRVTAWRKKELTPA